MTLESAMIVSGVSITPSGNAVAQMGISVHALFVGTV
jgi:hypothetical protein